MNVTSAKKEGTTMQKIIRGKRYNTETAHLCGDREYGDTAEERAYEALFQKRTGEFFLYGKGGVKSKYRKEVSLNNWAYGEEIIPLTDTQAKEWAETYLYPEDYQQFFTVEEPEETGKKIQSFSLSGDVIAKLTKLSRKHKMSRSKIIEDLVRKAD
jgi:hypothetical protein